MRQVIRKGAQLYTCIIRQRPRYFHHHRPRASSQQPPDSNRERAQSVESGYRNNETVHEDINGNGEPTEIKKAGLRRTLRQRRITEVPKPPPLPDWFLEHNVILHDDQHAQGIDAAEGLEYLDTDTGRVLFTTAHRPTDQGLPEALLEPAKVEEENDGASSGDKSLLHSIELPPTPNPIMWSMLQTETLARAALSLTGQNASSYATTMTDLSLHCPDWNAHAQMDLYVSRIASILEADVVRLDANDLADLTGDYVGQGSDDPGSFATLGHDVFDGRVSSKVEPFHGMETTISEERDPDEDDEREENEEEADGDESDAPESRGLDPSSLGSNLKAFRQLLQGRHHNLDRNMRGIPVAFSFAVPAGVVSSRRHAQRSHSKQSTESDYVQWDDARLSSLLDSLLDAPKTKKENGSAEAAVQATSTDEVTRGWTRHACSLLTNAISANQRTRESLTKLTFRNASRTSDTIIPNEGQRRCTIVHLRDVKDVCSSKLGDVIVKRLVKVVQKRRRAGEEILFIGTTAQDHPLLLGTMESSEGSSLINIVVPPLLEQKQTAQDELVQGKFRPVSTVLTERGCDRILEINLRNIGSMIRRLHPCSSTDYLFSLTKDQMVMPGAGMLVEKTLSQHSVHRLVLTAMGLSQSHLKSETLLPIHISLATTVIAQAEDILHRHRVSKMKERTSQIGSVLGEDGQRPGQSRLDRLKKTCNAHESRLLGGMVDPQNIKVGFGDVHVSPETIEALKTLTTLSLLRPDAFKYGVLAADNLSGLMLYGPPGTGKTLLAKAVAKESKATVLEISGAQIYEKYVGEGEKMVRAVFTLAKKLSPCVVFIDEADAIFGTRSSAGNRATHREIINQFLREWDGMEDHRVFMMVASNRPFDLDDAVLRRLPRRILVDLPMTKDRESILGIHLRNESLDEAVSLSQLAEQTPLYSGSDLKNLCVAAALAAVREEVDASMSHPSDSDGTPTERRVLRPRHFDKAMSEISASINEDMSSLSAIKKFDEQFGDRRGRKKKTGYGFSAIDRSVDENAARVRHGK